MAEQKKPFDDDLAIENILKEDELSKQKKSADNTKVKEEKIAEKEAKKEKIKDITLLSSKVFLAVVIFVFLVTMFFKWFNFSGETAIKGFVNVTDKILSQQEGVYVELSPLQLANHTFKNMNTYKIIHSAEGVEKTSIFSWMGMIYSWFFGLVFLLGITSIAGLLIAKDLKFISIVKVSSLISGVVILLNYITLRITYFSIFAINAESVVRIEETLSKSISMNKDGIAVGTNFLPYRFEVSNKFFIALVVLLIWIVTSSILTEVKSRMDNTKSIEEDIAKKDFKAKDIN